jgi:Xaa-Pro aminopeptidase
MNDPRTPAVDPQRRARRQPAFGLVDHRNDVDMARCASIASGRVQRNCAARDYAGVLLYDPVNIRYATGTRNMTIWTMHNAARYCFVPAQGKATIFDYRNCEHLATASNRRRGAARHVLVLLQRRRPPAGVVARWAREIDDLMRAAGGANRRWRSTTSMRKAAPRSRHSD